MDIISYWSAVMVDILIAVALVVRYRKQFTAARLSESKAKNLFTVLCLPISLAVSVIVFFVLLSVLDAPTGHGEILVSGPLSCLVVSAIVSSVGRSVVAWKAGPW